MRTFFLRSIFSVLVLALTITTTSAVIDPNSAQPQKATPETSQKVTTSNPLGNLKNLKLRDMEEYLGRKMTFAEKTAFRINKKKYVEFVKADENASTNGWAIAGFVTSFFIGPLGIIFSAIALGKIKKTGEKGRGLAIAGLIIGIVSTVLIFFL